MKAYLDTSFLVSLYVLDGNSPAAARAISGRDTLLLTPLTELEFTNALQLRVFRKDLTPKQALDSSQAFHEDLRNEVYTVLPLAPSVYREAMQLSRKHSVTLGTRSLDLLHVAAALSLEASVLYSFDAGQRRLSEAVSLKVLPKS